jgi:hypothetical protein
VSPGYRAASDASSHTAPVWPTKHERATRKLANRPVVDSTVRQYNEQPRVQLRSKYATPSYGSTASTIGSTKGKRFAFGTRQHTDTRGHATLRSAHTRSRIDADFTSELSQRRRRIRRRGHASERRAPCPIDETLHSSLRRPHHKGDPNPRSVPLPHARAHTTLSQRREPRALQHTAAQRVTCPSTASDMLWKGASHGLHMDFTLWMFGPLSCGVPPTKRRAER